MQSFLKSDDHAAGSETFTENSRAQEIPLTQIRADDRAQPRGSLIEAIVAE